MLGDPGGKLPSPSWTPGGDEAWAELGMKNELARVGKKRAGKRPGRALRHSSQQEQSTEQQEHGQRARRAARNMMKQRRRVWDEVEDRAEPDPRALLRRLSFIPRMMVESLENFRQEYDRPIYSIGTSNCRSMETGNRTVALVQVRNTGNSKQSLGVKMERSPFQEVWGLKWCFNIAWVTNKPTQQTFHSTACSSLRGWLY